MHVDKSTLLAVLSETEVLMDRKEERDIVRRGSLSEGEMKRLSQLRRVHR